MNTWVSVQGWVTRATKGAPARSYRLTAFEHGQSPCTGTFVALPACIVRSTDGFSYAVSAHFWVSIGTQLRQAPQQQCLHVELHFDAFGSRHECLSTSQALTYPLRTTQFRPLRQSLVGPVPSLS